MDEPYPYFRGIIAEIALPEWEGAFRSAPPQARHQSVDRMRHGRVLPISEPVAGSITASSLIHQTHLFGALVQGVCLMFTVQQAIAAGFEVYAVYDASGCWDQLSELTSIMRLVQMGAIVCNSLAVVADLQSDCRKPAAAGALALFRECNPFYDFLGSNQAANKKSA